MHTCTLHRKLEIVPGSLDDYEQLAGYHYRDGRLPAVKAVFALRPGGALGSLTGRPAGAIVYTMPVPRMELRNRATGNLFKGFDRQTQLSLINRNIRCISRIVIDPRLRGIGLATRLVRETLPLANAPVVEALGVLPRVNPFLEKAGMIALAPRLRLEQVELVEALSLAGIEDNELIDPDTVQKKLDSLSPSAADFIEIRIQQFLKSHGSRRTMPPGIERTRYLLGRLTDRPAYYIWFHPDLEIHVP